TASPAPSVPATTIWLPMPIVTAGGSGVSSAGVSSTGGEAVGSIGIWPPGVWPSAPSVGVEVMCTKIGVGEGPTPAALVLPRLASTLYHMPHVSAATARITITNTHQ